MRTGPRRRTSALGAPCPTNGAASRGDPRRCAGGVEDRDLGGARHGGAPPPRARGVRGEPRPAADSRGGAPGRAGEERRACRARGLARARDREEQQAGRPSEGVGAPGTAGFGAARFMRRRGRPGSVLERASVPSDGLEPRRGHDAAARGLLHVAAAQEVRLEDVLDRVLGLADDRREGLERRRARRVVGEAVEDASIHLLEAALVDAHLRERFAGEGRVDVARALHLRPVAGALEEATRDARGAAAPLREKSRALGIEPDAENTRRAVEDALEVGRRVGGEALYEAEAAAEGAGEQALARGRADERERLDEDREHSGVGARVEGHLDAEVLHRRVEVLLDPDRDPVDLVDEENVAASRLVRRPRRSFGLSRAGPLVEWSSPRAPRPRCGPGSSSRGPVARRRAGGRGLASALRRAEMSPEVLDDAVLAHELVEARRAQADLRDPLRALLRGRLGAFEGARVEHVVRPAAVRPPADASVIGPRSARVRRGSSLRTALRRASGGEFS